MFPEDLVSIRVGKWKLISNRGGLRDSNWYFERQDGYDRLNSSDTSLVTFLSNAFLDSMESLWETESRFDTIRDLAVRSVRARGVRIITRVSTLNVYNHSNGHSQCI